MAGERPDGLSRFPGELELLERFARDNLRELIADLERHGVACDLELTGELTPAIARYQLAELEQSAALHERHGYDVELFAGPESIQAELASPLFLGGLWVKDSGGVLDPAKLGAGLLAAARRAGVRVHEQGSPPPTGATGAAGCGSACSIASGWASTADPSGARSGRPRRQALCATGSTDPALRHGPDLHPIGMSRYRVLAWRGIPAQVKAEGDGEHAVSIQLDPWFMQHIDRVAMDEGLYGSDEYLSQWEWSEYREREGSAQEVADAIAAELETEWAPRRDSTPSGGAG